MAFTATIFAVLEKELGRHWLARFELLEHHTRPGAQTLQPGDEATISVWLRNDSGLTLRGVRGEIVASNAVRFERYRFSLGRLRSHVEVRVAEIRVLVGECDGGTILVDQVGNVRLTASADLSEFRFDGGSKAIVAAAPKKHSHRSPLIRYIGPEPAAPLQDRGRHTDERAQYRQPADAD